MIDEPEIIEEVICEKWRKEVAKINVLYYSGENIVDVYITYLNIDVTEPEILFVSQYRRIKDICGYFGLGHEKKV